jgi:hypothetical protein
MNVHIWVQPYEHPDEACMGGDIWTALDVLIAMRQRDGS